MIVIVMGVSGSGKSTIGRALARALALPFVEGDDYHPRANVEKMASGQPLDDADRAPWLEALAAVLAEAEQTGGSVLACSALKKRYRDVLKSELSTKPQVVYLDGSASLLAERLAGRDGHFFPPHLLASQFEALEPPADAIYVDLRKSVEEIVSEAVAALRAVGGPTPPPSSPPPSAAPRRASR